MSEIWPIVATGIVGSLSGILGTTFIAKRMMSDEKIIEKVETLLSEVAQNPEMQKNLYLIGGLLGKGVRDGTGINALVQKKKGGLEGILLDLVGNFIGNRFIKQAPEQEQQPQLENKSW
jgi:hypothetical protein